MKRFLWRAMIMMFVGSLLIQQTNAQLINEHIYKFHKVLSWINSFYVDSVNQDELVEDAIIEMLKNLDPHSQYISKEEVKAMSEPLKGNFEGIGISFNVLNDTIYVISPISGGPSEKVGMMAGDRIVKIEGENVAGIGIKSTDVQKKLKGDKGTKVTVSVKRRGADELIDFTITRDVIPINSVDASYMINDKTGYIKINRFSLTTMDEFRESTKKLSRNGMKDVIVDLTGNGGGYLDVAIELADEFLAEDKLIVYTEGLNSPKIPYKATKKGEFEDARVIVLIDEGSASASEIFAGALQDWDRGVVIGRRSFGKGLVQRQFVLPDNSMIRLTVARYHTPTGRLIQKPYDEGKKEYDKDILNRYNRGELSNKDSIEFPDSLKYRTLVDKRIVYGGGGIMPDVFIPLDTSSYSDYYRDLVRSGVLNRFILEYVDENRKDLLKKYRNFEEFKKSFQVSNEIMDALGVYANENDIQSDENDHEEEYAQISNVIKARIAGDLWDTSEFYEIINQEDPGYQKAIEIMENWKDYMANLHVSL